MAWWFFSGDSKSWRRSLAPDEDDLLAEHLLRLPAEDRRARFMHETGADAMFAHARNHTPMDRRVIGWFHMGLLRGAVELHFSADVAEAAITVEPAFRRSGVASGLMKSALRAAGNRGVRRVIVRTGRGNEPVRRIARASGALFRTEEGDLTGEIDAGSPSAHSIIFDCAEERNGVIASLAAATIRRLTPRRAQ